MSKETPPEVNVLDMNLNGPVISIRPYTHTDHYWQVYFDTNETILRVAKEAGWPAPTSPGKTGSISTSPWPSRSKTRNITNPHSGTIRPATRCGKP